LRQAQQRFRPDKELWRIPQLYFVAKALEPVVDFRVTHKRLSILRACSIKVPKFGEYTQLFHKRVVLGEPRS
jgi:hypothetical protein